MIIDAPGNVNDIKSVISIKTRPLELCEDFQSLMIAESEEDIINAGMDHIEWAYTAGIINDAFMAKFTDETLNANGIYNVGNHDLVDPVYENLVNPNIFDIVVTGHATVKLTVNETRRVRVLVVSDYAAVQIIANDYVHLKVVRINNLSLVSIELNDSASCLSKFGGDGIVTVTSNNDSVFHTVMEDKGQIFYTGKDNSAGVLKLLQLSKIAPNISGAAVNNTKIKYFEQSSIISADGL